MEENNLQNNVSNTAANAQPAAVVPADNPDISKTTIAVLVLLTLMISVIGTWTVLNEISNVRPTGSNVAAPQSGQVHLNIQPPTTPQTSAATGKVMMNILDNKQ